MSFRVTDRPTAFRTAPAVFFELAREHPEAVRFVEGDRPYTFAQVAERVRGLARHLSQEGVGRGDHVAIFSPNCVDWVVSALAVQAVGGAFVGVHAGSSAELARYVVEHSHAKRVIAAPSELARTGLEGFSVPTLTFGEAFERALSPGEFADRSRLEDAACLIYTSGTTGKPKGVVLTHRNLATNGIDWISVCGPLVPDGAREVAWLPFSHIFGWGGICIGALMGFTSHLVPPHAVPEALVQVRPHVLMTVPVLLERIARQAPNDESLRKALGGDLALTLAGGAALSPTLKQRFRSAGLLLLEGYGLTETSPTLTLCRPGDDALDTVGRPYPSVEICLAPDGEILARGPSVFSGYYRDPEATREALDPEGWFHTGDIGDFTPDGQLKVIDRKKELLVLANGKKVPPQPIEALAAEDPWIERLVLFGTNRPAPLALVVPNLATVARELGRELDASSASRDPSVVERISSRLEALNQRLSTYERIKSFALAPRPLTIEEGHLTPSLKVRRKAVWSAFQAVLEPPDAAALHPVGRPASPPR